MTLWSSGPYPSYVLPSWPVPPSVPELLKALLVPSGGTECLQGSFAALQITGIPWFKRSRVDILKLCLEYPVDATELRGTDYIPT